MGPFENKAETIKIVEGAYRKLKSYYFYNKNFILMRKKIVDFESDEAAMTCSFETIAQFLLTPDACQEVIKQWIEQIDLFVLPKKFVKVETKNSSQIISNKTTNDKILSDVNYFIDAPIEIHILDVILCILIGEEACNNKLLSSNIYGNTLNTKHLYNIGTINWSSTILFNTYFNKYSQWRNNAFSALESNYKSKKDSLLVTMDLKGYYYSVRLSSQKIKVLLSPYYCGDFDFLFNLFDDICSAYIKKLSRFRKLDSWCMPQDEYCLPIGLMTSMVVSNIYLTNFDKYICGLNNIAYYGRYVDDIIIVFNQTIVQYDDEKNYVEEILLSRGIINNRKQSKGVNSYSIYAHPELEIQDEKIKMLYIDHTESGALIDLYNEKIKITPSSMQPIPPWDLKLNDFDETAYLFDEFSKSFKIRDIGEMTINAYEIGKYFSQLVAKFAHVAISKNDVDVNKQINKIDSFFCGMQGIEYYTQWQNYMYFLALIKKDEHLKDFYRSVKRTIKDLHSNLSPVNKYANRVIKRVKECLRQHLDICFFTSFALLIDRVPEIHKKQVSKYLNANMFNHNLLSLPLSNYIYDGSKSLLDLSVDDLKVSNTWFNSSRFKWTPRFIHYDEFLMVDFYYQHNKNKSQRNSLGDKRSINRYIAINNIVSPTFEIIKDKAKTFTNENEEIVFRRFVLPQRDRILNNINICTPNIALSPQTCFSALNEKIMLKNKKAVWEILRNVYSNCKCEIKILVMPELFYPIQLISDLVDFSRKAQVAIVTGLCYIKKDNNTIANYIATILPFEYNGYRNTTIFIREKNDYSPIERHELIHRGYYCQDAVLPDYQIFEWNGLAIAPMICYEITDIMARALFKGKVDIIALPVFNQDTAYFSNIIDSAVRDLHCVIVQANTSVYGDSRVTLPYDRDNKDIFKIKGGDNDNVMVGTLNIGDIFSYQSNYYINENEYNKHNFKKEKATKGYPDKNSGRQKPNIKRLSARFHNKRTK